MLELATLQQTGDACPSQWEGVLTDGTPVYIRYRWGKLRVELHPWSDEKRQVVYGAQLGDGLDGVLDEEDMLKAVAGVIRKV